MDEKEKIEAKNLPETSQESVAEKQEVEVVEQDTKVPAKYFFVMNAQRLGEVFSNISILASVVAALMLLGMVVMPFAMIFNFFIAIIIVVFSLGLILLEINFSDLILIKENSLSMFIEFAWKITPYLMGAILALSVISLIFLCFNRQKLSGARIVFNVIFILFAVVGVIIASVQG